MAKDEPEQCKPSFQSRLAEWSEQCLRFQSSGETWVPTKPCCPANPVLGLEAFLWQGEKKHQARACVELLSIEELLTLHRHFLATENRQHPQPASGVVSPSLVCLQVRPWAGESPQKLPATDRTGSDEASAANPSGLKQSPILSKASGSALTELSPAKRNPDSPSTKKRINEVAKAEKLKWKPQKAKGVSYCSRSRSWRVAVWDPTTKTTKFGGYFPVKKDALAQARKLAKKFKRRPGSDVKGVYWYRNGWHVRIYDAATQKLKYGGSFKVKKEAEARAKELAKDLGACRHSKKKQSRKH